MHLNDFWDGSLHTLKSYLHTLKFSQNRVKDTISIGIKFAQELLKGIKPLIDNESEINNDSTRNDIKYLLHKRGYDLNNIINQIKWKTI